MRKREKTFYIVIIAVLIGTFTVSIVPDTLPPPCEEQADTLVVEDTIVPVFRISPYDSLFRVYADTIGWDWKMLAAVAYVESKFDTAATSNVGAQGLMQMMPETAHAMGVPEGMERDPGESVRAAADYFKYLSRLFRRVPEGERRYFVLASYNAGFGHIQDAMRLAEKYGKNRHVWNENVETFLRLKNDSIYYTDSLCRNGRFTGIETTLFVRKVQHKYSEYCLREERYWQTHRDTTHYTPRAVPISPNEDIANEALPNDSTQNILAQLWR
ncbi:MAG: transglycosylase SLT domain-containing protein [Bacteroidaceae bacterium]|nr:transglycosylase SLT domain-containing protein [Bacteroidaceae bacterium]MBR3983936.1 transglycosylase SLT domain-containing protein [Bacteroidaceae bacterium]